jgi:betaine reductase
MRFPEEYVFSIMDSLVNPQERRFDMGNWLKGKTAIIIGERDGVQGPSIAKCLEAAGANVVFAVTECFV